MVIVGCGRVGSALAQQLVADGGTVAIIDRREVAFQRLVAHPAIERIVGVGFDRQVLLEAGIERADAVAAVTSGDNSNVLIARVARESFGVERVVARIYDPKRAALYQRLGISTVATVSWTTEQVLRRLQPAPTAVEWTDPTGQVTMLERRIDTMSAGRRYGELVDDPRVNVVAITRLGTTHLADLSLVSQEGDLVYLAVRTAAIDALDDRLVGVTSKVAHA